MTPTPQEITQLLVAWGNGGRAALDNLMPLVYEELRRLAHLHEPRKSQIVELRFFGELSIEEASEVLKVSPGTIMREWTLAKAWLRREMTANE